MQNNNYKNECSPVSTHVSDETKTWLDNMKNKYSIDISTQLFYVVSKMIKSEKQLEKIVVASLLDDHESKGNTLREMASELGIKVNVNVADKIASRMMPVVNANVVDVFSKHKKTGVETANMINECLDKNSDVNTVMKSKLEEVVSQSNVQVKKVDEIDWQRLANWKYKDLDILGVSFENYSILKEDNIKKGFKNGLYATLHSQALGLWRDEEKELSIRDIAKLQPYQTPTGDFRILTIPTIVKRLIKAIVHFGTGEEKQLLFGTFQVYPHKAKKKSV